MKRIPRLVDQTAERDGRIKHEIAAHLRPMPIHQASDRPPARAHEGLRTWIATEVNLMPAPVFLTLCTLLFACVTAAGVAASILVR